jgi:hypothetical protein
MVAAERGAFDHVLPVDEQQQRHRGAALQREAAVLPQPVDREVQAAGSAGDSLGLSAEHPMLERTQAGDVLDRLGADAHLISVVGARIRESVDSRADAAAKDATVASDRFGHRGVRLHAVGTPIASR